MSQHGAAPASTGRKQSLSPDRTVSLLSQTKLIKDDEASLKTNLMKNWHFQDVSISTIKKLAVLVE